MREQTFEINPDRVKHFRDEWGKKTEIAKSMGISPQRLGNWLSGRKGIPESYLRSLASVANIPMIDLLSDESRKFFSITG